jgi:hypothetical protein
MGNVTNLDFIELLLEAGDQMSRIIREVTPLVMWTMGSAPGATKFLLNWPATDAQYFLDLEGSVLGGVRKNVEHLPSSCARHTNSCSSSGVGIPREMLVAGLPRTSVG